MDTRLLTTFVYVAELASFTRAAAALGYAQSTVSFQIKQLEAELGAKLFERINHTVAGKYCSMRTASISCLRRCCAQCARKNARRAISVWRQRTLCARCCWARRSWNSAAGILMCRSK